VRRVAESFGWPFRGAWRSVWAIGLLTVLFLPLLFILFLGYAIAATRAAERDPSQGPPKWRLSLRLIVDGSWTAFAIALTVLPFAIAWHPLADALPISDPVIALAVVFFLLALPWGLLVLLVIPRAAASYAATGNFHELFDIAASIRGVRRDFTTWNGVVAAIVTAWAIGLAGAGLLCVGIFPGIFYAILVSAHAAAALHRESPPPPAG